MMLTAGLMIGPVCGEARAATVVAYNFSGTLATVTGLTGVDVGDRITGSFSYDSAQTGSLSTGLYTFTGSARVHTFKFQIFNSANQQVFADVYTGSATVPTGGLYQAQVTYHGTSGTTFDLAGDTIFKYGAGFTSAAYDLTITNPSNGGPTGGYKPNNLVLPTTSILNSFFTLTKASMVWDPPGVDGPQSFTTDDLVLTDATVPEPAGLLLAALGLSTGVVGSLIARRRQSAARRARRGSPS
jgi:hypothetical protein